MSGKRRSQKRQGIIAAIGRGLAGGHECAFTVAESRDFGVIRKIVPDPSRVAELLDKKGYNLQKVEVPALRVADEPGGLGKALRTLVDENMNVECLRTFPDQSGGQAVVSRERGRGQVRTGPLTNFPVVYKMPHR